MLKLYLKLGIELPTGGSAFSFFNLVQYFEQLFRNFTRNVFILGDFFILILNTGPVTTSTIHHDKDPH